MRKQFAVIGHPIEHSRSPELHQAFAQKTGIELDYHKRLAALDGFETSMQRFFAEGGIGMNVTVPFKEQAFAQCQVLSPRAQIAQAVNTLWMQDGQLHACRPGLLSKAPSQQGKACNDIVFMNKSLVCIKRSPRNLHQALPMHSAHATLHARHLSSTCDVNCAPAATPQAARDSHHRR